MPTEQLQGTDFRRHLTPGDRAAIVELHRRVYEPEYAMNEEFLARVDEGIQTAIETGWPHRTGAVWLVDDRPGSALSGSLGLTDEGDGTGRVRWFTLAAELRGRGLGRAMLGELLCEARGAGMRTLKLETFSALTTAAHLYRDAGFRVVAERQRLDWGPPISYQHYELKLA